MHIYIYIHIIRSPRLTGQAMQWRDALRVGHHPFAARGDVTRNPGWALGAVALRCGTGAWLVRFLEIVTRCSAARSRTARPRDSRALRLLSDHRQRRGRTQPTRRRTRAFGMRRTAGAGAQWRNAFKAGARGGGPG